MSFLSKWGILLAVLYFLTYSYGALLTRNYSSYRMFPWCEPSDYMRYPCTSQEVVDIVKEAIRRNVTVKAFGARHSQTDIICTEGIPIDMHKLNSLKMNSDGVTATVGAGATLRTTTEFLRKNGRALRTTPAYGNITIGGAIGTGAHGSSIKYTSSISSQVVKLTVVNGLGELLVISDPEELKAFRLHLGLLGIVVDVTLITVPLYKAKAHNYVLPDDVLTNGLIEQMAKISDQISLNWFPAFKEVVVSDLTFVDVTTPGEAFTNAVAPATYDLTSLALSTAAEIASELTSSTCAAASAVGYTILHAIEYLQEVSMYMGVPLIVPTFSEDGTTNKNPAVGYSDLMFAPVCTEVSTGLLGLACAWAHGNVCGNLTFLDNEFGLPLSKLAAFVTSVQDIISKTPTAFPIQGILIRFSGKSDTYMSTSYGKDTVHFEFFPYKRKNFYDDAPPSTAGYQTILQEVRNKFNGQSHWGKSGPVYHDSDSLDLKLDPVARKNFVAAMDKFDPNELFINNFGRRMKRTGSKLDTDPSTKHCALLDQCFCSKNSDCGRNQICTRLPEYRYNVCKTKNEIPEESCNRSLFPPIGTLLSWLGSTAITLAKATLANCTVTGLLDTVGGLLG